MTNFSSPKKLLLVGILSAVFAVNVIDIFVPLMLPEIAAFYGITRSQAATLTAFSSLAGVATGFALSAVSIKVRYKTLLAFGAAMAPICILGVYLAPTFLTAQLFYTLNGVGSVVVAVMSPSLIAELYPLNKKATRISWSASTAFVATLIASPLTGFLSNTGAVTSWRNSLLWFLLPATTVCLLLVILLVPSKTSIMSDSRKKAPFMQGFREVLGNKSARACLTNSFLGAIWLAASVFSFAFYADVFFVPPSMRGIVSMITLSALVPGILVGGFLVNPVGRKRLFMASAFSAVIVSFLSYVIMLFIPNLWLSVGIRTVSSFLGGFVFAAGPNLLVEQIPRFRGTMMSLSHGLNGIGVAIGVFIGGAALNYFGNTTQGYAIAIGSLAFLGLMGTLNIFLFAKDPCINQQTQDVIQVQNL